MVQWDVSEDVVRDLVFEADEDGDGCLDYREFVQMLEKTHDPADPSIVDIHRTIHLSPLPFPSLPLPSAVTPFVTSAARDCVLLYLHLLEFA